SQLHLPSVPTRRSSDLAPGGAFDPKKLETLPVENLGYRAKWQVVRYKYYGIDWDIAGLQLTPNKPEPGLPTLAIINGGSANFYRSEEHTSELQSRFDLV